MACTQPPHQALVFLYLFFCVACLALSIADTCSPFVRYIPDQHTKIYYYYYQFVTHQRVPTNARGPDNYQLLQWQKSVTHFGNSYHSYLRNPIPFHVCRSAYNALEAGYAFNVAAAVFAFIASVSGIVFIFLNPISALWTVSGFSIIMAAICLAIAIPIDLSLYTMSWCHTPPSGAFVHTDGINLSSLVGLIVAAVFCALMAILLFAMMFCIHRKEAPTATTVQSREPVDLHKSMDF